MAISMIRQKLGNKIFVNYVPADDENAKAFADALLPGEYEILKKVGESGSDTATDARFYSVMLRNEESHEKTYLSFYAKSNKTTNDVISALKGKTFNGVKADTVIILKARKVVYSTSDDSSDSGSGS